MQWIKISQNILFIILSILLIQISYANNTNNNFYIKIGTGIAFINHFDLTKTFKDKNDIIATPYYIGNINGQSTPVFFGAGYQFNQFINTELNINYSGNQSLDSLRNEPKHITPYWSSQTIISLDAIGKLPINDNLNLTTRIGVGVFNNTITTFAGDPKTIGFTDVLGIGLQYNIYKHVSIGIDYIGYGILFPMPLILNPLNPQGPFLGVVDTAKSNNFIFDITYVF